MDVNATIDVGKNLTSLVEKLAQHIGTTADKVFPWYVQQAHNEGVTTLVAIAVVVVIVGFIFLAGVLMWVRGEKDVSEFGGFVTGLSGLALCGVFLIGSIEGVEAARKIMNPNYYAMTAITRDIGRLTAR
jgi:hypothetical protein